MLYTGKGGVGKTTTAAAAAVGAARRGRRALVISADAAHSLGDVLERRLASEPTEIEPGLDALEIDARSETRRYWERIQEYLVSLAGESEWARNVRAAGGRAVLRRRGDRPVCLVELPPEERAPVLAAYIDREGKASAKAAARTARYYFGLPPEPSPEQIVAVAGFYPVFRVEEA